MNETVKEAYELNKLQVELGGWECEKLPDVEVGDICTLADVWNGEGEAPESNYCYLVTEHGWDGSNNMDVWLGYFWDVLEESENVLNTKIKITEISLI